MEDLWTILGYVQWFSLKKKVKNIAKYFIWDYSVLYKATLAFPVHTLLSFLSYREGQYLNIYNIPYLCKAVCNFTNVITWVSTAGYVLYTIQELFSLVRLWHSSQFPGALQLLKETFVNNWCGSKQLAQSRVHLWLCQMHL